jgi:cell division protein FtsQ
MRRTTFIWHWLLPFIILCLFVAAGCFVWSYVQAPTTFPFKQVKIISPDSYVDSKVLQRTVNSNVNGGFFSLDIKTLQSSLQALPWVASVSIRKLWPARLLITVVSQQPLARWNHDAVINQAGQLFYPPESTIPAYLPQLSGPDTAEQDVLGLFRTLTTDLAMVNLKVKTLSLTQRLSWTIVLSNGILIKLGRTNMQQRFKQFVQLYPRLIAGHVSAVTYVDLRYPDGLSIKWGDN